MLNQSCRFRITVNQPVTSFLYALPTIGPADYRIFVRSMRFTPREAAALIVSACGEQLQLAAAL